MSLSELPLGVGREPSGASSTAGPRGSQQGRAQVSALLRRPGMGALPITDAVLVPAGAASAVYPAQAVGSGDAFVRMGSRGAHAEGDT
jgi:hypothetical protein